MRKMVDAEKRKKPNVKEIVCGKFMKVWKAIAINVMVVGSISIYALYENDHTVPALLTDLFGE